jgi:adenosylcobinamide kinase/adenosylcobinamide-phosphate guanylyltransferase
MLTLVLGGARSGKSRFAQSLCVEGKSVAFIATARPDDDEMRARIAMHREQRPSHWKTVEAPLAIAEAAIGCSNCGYILLDCLTIWLSNFCWERRNDAADVLQVSAAREVERLIATAGTAHLVIVTNEVGYGLVPETPVGRLFRDVHGWLNQDVARAADFVYQVVAGIPIAIKRPEVTR